MDLILRVEYKVEEEEVATPKTKKRRTSKKKSPSKTKSAEPSTLVKRTRSTVKCRKVKVVEEEESEEEEDETDEEQDKKEKFGKRTILKGKLLSDLEEEGMVMLLQKLQLQGWKNMVFQMDRRLARAEIVVFMGNCEIRNGRVTSVVKGVTVSFDDKELGEILGVHTEGYNDYKKLKWSSLENLPTSLAITRKFADNELELEAKAVYKSEMKPPHKVLFEFVNKSGAKDIENERLKKRPAEVETEKDALRVELAKDKEKNEGILHDMLQLLQARNQEPSPSQP
uniref:Nucleolin-like n=1 Tax=Nicotiana tabacum TaxID=4097 RepID=A0A1S3YSA5_TOBAC|nr:PREDICTED: nucleolin-like [Nicotiana tabacum]